MKCSGWSAIRAIWRHVVGDEIEQQLHAAFGESLAGNGETLPAAEMLVDDVAARAVCRLSQRCLRGESRGGRG